MLREEGQHTEKFIHETGLTYEQVAVKTQDIPVAKVAAVPLKCGEPFVTKEEETTLGMQMYNFRKWYLIKSKEEMTMFAVKYHDKDFFRGEDDFCVDFEMVHAVYCRDAHNVSILTVWVL